MLKTKVFAGSITNLTDARYFAARGAQYLGFNLDESASLSISPEKAMAIKEWVEGPQFVGVFQYTTPIQIKTLTDRLQLDLVQTGPFVSQSDLKESLSDKPLIREIIVEQIMDLNALKNEIDTLSSIFDFLLINFEKTGIDWPTITQQEGLLPLLKSWSDHYKLIVAISHLPGQTDQIIQQLQPYGLYVQGGEEEKTGFKSFDQLDALFDLLETEEEH